MATGDTGLEDGLSGGRGSAHIPSVLEAEDAAVPGTAYAAVVDRPLGQGATHVTARVRQNVHTVSALTHDQDGHIVDVPPDRSADGEVGDLPDIVPPRLHQLRHHLGVIGAGSLPVGQVTADRPAETDNRQTGEPERLAQRGAPRARAVIDPA